MQVIDQLEAQLRDELRSEGVDPDKAALAEDDSMFDENGEVKETGHVDENGEMRRPWCAATRILEHRESVGYVGCVMLTDSDSAGMQGGLVME